MAWQKINLDISGESNKRNKFVKCSEHYFSGREFIVYVQLSPSLSSSFQIISASRLKPFNPKVSMKLKFLQRFCNSFHQARLYFHAHFVIYVSEQSYGKY